MASKIEWTQETWNPVVGCTKCSPGCKNCYAEKMAWRLRGMRVHPYWPAFDDPEIVDSSGWTGEVHLCHERVGGQIDALCKPLHWRKPREIFVCSMSDLFGEKECCSRSVADAGSVSADPGRRVPPGYGAHQAKKQSGDIYSLL